MSAEVVRRFIGGYGGNARWSIRRRPDGAFQIYQDNPYEGINQPYQFDDRAVSGLFADIEDAEAELFRNPEFRQQESD
jgi:hypothetical protein